MNYISFLTFGVPFDMKTMFKKTKKTIKITHVFVFVVFGHWTQDCDDEQTF